MDFNIEELTEDHLSLVVCFAREFAAFENLEEYCEITESKLQQAMFGTDAFVEGLIAFCEGRAIGYALFYPNFSSFRGERGFYLEDLFIVQEFRSKGVGKLLLGEIAKRGQLRGYERIDFQVLDWNTPAVEFYTRLGAERNIDERHFKFSGAGFANLLS